MKRSRKSNGRGAAEHARLHEPKSFYNLQDALKAGVTEIFQAMRLARGFERQKLGRREKDAKEAKAVDDVARIEKEIVTLKGFDLAAMAEFYFYKTLLRIPSVSSAPQFPESVAKKVAESSKSVDAMFLNVSARLYKSNAVATALEGALGTVYEVTGVEPQPGRKKRLRKSDFQSPSRLTANQQSHTNQNSPSHQEANSAEAAEPGLRMSKLLEVETESAIVKDVENAADSVAEDASENSSSGVELDMDLEEGAHSSESEVEAELGQRPAAARKPLTSTAFLPSLAGGYISGSESEASDIEDADGGKALKNRPGQRARQAHWERKYGNKAAHLQKQRQSRDFGWDSKRGAQDPSSRGNQQGKIRGGKQSRRDKTTTSGGRGSKKTPNAQSRAKPSSREHQGSRAKEGPLHPSWEAAKKLKEQKNAAAFQGKKILFD